MDHNQLYFAYPLWFWALLVIPLLWGLYFLYYRGQQPKHQLEKFIDKHLIPYLVLSTQLKKKKVWIHLLIWSLVCSCLVVALAGPRWNLREIDTFTRDQTLAILLDLSESMNAKDVLPSRLVRAKQTIEDLLTMSKGVKIGLIAFAADPHMIVPLTEDKETIRHLLPSLDPDLVYMQGSKLSPALEMAAAMFKNEKSNNNAIVVISDGGFEDASAIHTAKKLAETGITLYTIGVGSLDGVPLRDHQNAMVKKNGSPVISRLEKEKFSEISNIGHGRYFSADHLELAEQIFADLEKRSDILQKEHKTHHIWEERFYLFLLPVLPFFLWWYRRGSIFALILFILLPTYSQASLNNYFYNREQQGNQAYENGDYTIASDVFQDPYRKGVAYYRMGDYSSAEEMFRQSSRPEVASSAAYNLGNSLVQQNKLKEAIAAYEDVLKKWPDHKQAKENLELVKKMLEQQEQQQGQENQDKQSNNQKSEQQQELKEDASKEQHTEKQSNNQPQNDSASEENKTDNTQQPQNPNSEESFQYSPNEEELPKHQNDNSKQQEIEKPTSRSQEDLDADLWLNQMKSDPKSFLKNKFYLESKKNGTKQEIDPW